MNSSSIVERCSQNVDYLSSTHRSFIILSVLLEIASFISSLTYSHFPILILFQFYSHSSPILFPFYFHSIPVLFPFYSNSNPILFPFYSHTIPILFPFYSHSNPILFLSHPIPIIHFFIARKLAVACGLTYLCRLDVS